MAGKPGPLGRLLRGLREILTRRRRLRQELDPQAFRRLARELTDLARLARALWPRQHAFQDRINKIMGEMEQLDRLASAPEFRRLSTRKRLELRRSLIQSRDQLLETVHGAPTPTQRLQ